MFTPQVGLVCVRIELEQNMFTRIATFVTTAAVSLLTTTVLWAQANPLEQVPDSALGFAVIPNLTEANDKIGVLTAKMQFPVPDVLTLVKGMVGIGEGMDDAGGLAIAAVPSSDDEEAPLAWYGFVPVTDYQEFIKSLAPRDVGAEITEVTVFGQAMLVGEKGKFAVIAMDSEHPEALKKLVADDTSIVATVAPLKEWMAEQQLSIVITPSGKTQLFQTISAALPDQEQLEADAGVNKGDDDDDSDDAESDDDDAAEKEGELPPGALAGVAQMFGGFKTLLADADKQLTHLAVGLKIEDNATLHLAARALFAPGGEPSQWAKQVKLPPEGLLAGVPPGDFVFAYGAVSADFSPEIAKIISSMTETGLEMYGLDEEGKQRYAEATAKMQAGKRFTGGVMGMLRPGDSLYATSLSVEHVENGDDYVKQMRESFKVLEASVKSPKTEEPLYTVADIKVGEHDAVEVTTDFEALMGAAAGEAEDAIAQGFMDKLFGLEGKIRMLFAKANDTVVVTAYSQEQLVRGIEHVRSGAEGLEADADVAKTTAMLPSGSQWVAYADPQGVVQMIGTFMEGMFGAEMKLPSFPPSEPIGLSARVNETALDAEIVLPENFVAGLGQFILAVGQMFQGGGPVP